MISPMAVGAVRVAGNNFTFWPSLVKRATVWPQATHCRFA